MDKMTKLEMIAEVLKLKNKDRIILKEENNEEVIYKYTIKKDLSIDLKLDKSGVRIVGYGSHISFKKCCNAHYQNIDEFLDDIIYAILENTITYFKIENLKGEE